jgi:hypothetical protein
MEAEEKGREGRRKRKSGGLLALALDYVIDSSLGERGTTNINYRQLLSPLRTHPHT